MAISRHIPIRYKFLAVLLVIMLIAFAIFFQFSFRMFSQDKTVFIMDLNLNVLTAMTHILKQEIGTRLEYIQSIAPRIYSLPKKEGKSFKGYGTSLSDEVLSLSFFKKSSSGKLERFRYFENIELLQKNQITAKDLKNIYHQHPLPLSEFSEQQQLTLINRSVLHSETQRPLPIITVLISGTSFNKKESVVISVDFLQDFLIDKLKESDLADILLVSREGDLLSHADPAQIVKYASETYDHPLVKRIQENRPSKESMEMSIKGKEYLCNVGEVGISNLFIISQIRKEEAFLALKMLLIKSLILAAVILFASVAGSIAFTTQITKNIEKLESAAAQIGAGDLDAKIDIKSNDEIGKVSDTFQWMAGRIKKLLNDTKQKVRMEEELKTAQLMQATILAPPQVSSDHLELVYHYSPATECGGDIWDVKMSNNRATVFLGDATGHGASAALVTSLVKSCFSTLHTRYVDRPLAPEEVLDALNTIIYDSCRGKLLMTMVIVQLDFRTGEFYVANAGHESPFCLRNGSKEKSDSKTMSGNIDVLLARGERLGYEQDYKYGPESYRLQVGDVVLLYSDGLTEASNAKGKHFGERNLRKIISSTRYAPLSQIKKEILSAVSAHIGKTDLEDDLTFVLLRWKKPLYISNNPPPKSCMIQRNTAICHISFY